VELGRRGGRGDEGGLKILLSIDPGTRGTGVALFHDGKLHAAEYVRNPYKEGSGPRECAAVAQAVSAWAAEHVGPVFPVHMDVMLEFPQTYGGRASTGNTEALFPLAAIDGALAALFSYANVMHCLPHSWKGSIDPDAIVERVKDRLSVEEKSRIVLPAAGLQHNVFDAIGVGLKFLGRFERRRVFASE
jgi:hypothetical protein